MSVQCAYEALPGLSHGSFMGMLSLTEGMVPLKFNLVYLPKKHGIDNVGLFTSWGRIK